jgi:hypothetical protein
MDDSGYLLIDYRHHQVLCTIPNALDRPWLRLVAPSPRPGAQRHNLFWTRVAL